MENELEKKYRSVWETTLRNGQITVNNVAGSTFFFEHTVDGTLAVVDGVPVPKRFDTYAMVCCLPFPEDIQKILEDYWKQCMALLGNPVAYGVTPFNRHVEIFLFQRPEELFSSEQIKTSIESSLPLAKKLPPFKISFRHPFMTPDGTIVVPGFENTGIIETFRSELRKNLPVFPQKQSQWLHTSLGRILEPLPESKMAPLLKDMELNWGKVIGEVEVTELLWTWEKQWYMVDKEILHKLEL